MIPPSNINTLYTASRSRENAAAAPTEQERAAVARAINLASNTGELRTIWNNYISDALKTELMSQGYGVNPMTNSVTQSDGRSNSWIISWE